MKYIIEIEVRGVVTFTLTDVPVGWTDRDVEDYIENLSLSVDRNNLEDQLSRLTGNDDIVWDHIREDITIDSVEVKAQ